LCQEKEKQRGGRDRKLLTDSRVGFVCMRERLEIKVEPASEKEIEMES
jgi:hypothetical protein